MAMKGIPGATTDEKIQRIANVDKAEVLQKALGFETDDAVKDAILARLTALAKINETDKAPAEETPKPVEAADPTYRRLMLVNARSYMYAGQTSFNIKFNEKTPPLPPEEYERLLGSHMFREVAE